MAATAGMFICLLAAPGSSGSSTPSSRLGKGEPGALARSCGGEAGGRGASRRATDFARLLRRAPGSLSMGRRSAVQNKRALPGAEGSGTRRRLPRARGQGMAFREGGARGYVFH